MLKITSAQTEYTTNPIGVPCNRVPIGYAFTRSRKHHMFGTVDEWLYHTLAGVKPVDCQNLTIKPFFCKDVQWAGAKVPMPSGTASCKWERRENGIIVTVKIPFNVTATLQLPDQKTTLGNGEYEFEVK